jgi:hypothetical protein
VIVLLSKHCAEKPAIVPTHQDISSQDSSAVYPDTPHSEQDTSGATSDHRRQRLKVSDALKNLVNRSGQIALQLFTELDRRLKSSEMKHFRGKGKGNISGQQKK